MGSTWSAIQRIKDVGSIPTASTGEKMMWKILLYCFGLYALVCGLAIVCVSRKMQKEVDEIMDAVQITHEEDE